MEKKIYQTPELRKLDVEQTQSGPLTSSATEDETYSPSEIDPS